ncbi:hypothetical protein RI129_004781 [Pyrocoelia pectoralis]|uniref:A-kinase anchor protein 7-like phosphoesterase domain-containing protein n=1 Tax=Pyrocoelia pectoralis TaxID=417401 RepID=A0AAN7VEL2_9COLE
MAKIYSTKPVKMWIDGTSFNVTKFEKISSIRNNLLKSSDYDFTLSKTDNYFTTSFQLPSIYYTHLHTFPALGIKKLEIDTRTAITVPENEDGNIIISGDNENDVVNARHFMHSIIGEIRSKLPAAQFISIPVNSEEVQRNFQRFKDEIMNGDPIEGIHETIFQSPLKLHLTIGVLALMNTLEKEEAVNALNACKTEVIDRFITKGNQLKIQVSGINCMNDNHSKVNILYANAKIVQADDEDILQKLANAITDYFYNRGLVIQYTDNVKLHVTLMNTKYRKASTPSTPKKSKWHWKKQSFDARSILDKYKDFYFGEKILDSIHLSYMSSKGEDGFYKPLSIIRF